MYVFIKKEPTQDDMVFFKMKENINENFRNFSVNPNLLSVEEKKILVTKYNLSSKAMSYTDFIFLAMPNS